MSETTDHPQIAAFLECECNPGTGGSSRRDTFTERAASMYYRVRPRVAFWLPKIRHWRVREGSYETLKNPRATWFIDPPYQGRSGQRYAYGQIDWVHLAAWTRARTGWTCDQAGATWLPFSPLRTVATLAGDGGYRLQEVYWTSRWPMVLNDRY